MKTFTEEQIKNLISHFQSEAERAFDLADRWEGSGTTYGDTDKLAEDVEWGRHEVFLEVAERLNNLISYGSAPQLTKKETNVVVPILRSEIRKLKAYMEEAKKDGDEQRLSGLVEYQAEISAILEKYNG